MIGRQRKHSPPLAHQTFSQKRIRCWAHRGAIFYAEYNIRLFFYLLWIPVDIYCAIDLDTILPNLVVSKLRGKVRVYDAHEYFTEVPEVVRRPSIQKIWSSIASWAIPQFPYCYTVGEALAGILSERYGPSFEVIRNVPVKTRNVPDQNTPPPFIILYQGVLNEGRGLEVLIQAMQELGDVELWLTGEGDLSQVLRELTDELNLNERVKFLGYLAPTDLQEITPQAHLGVNLLENKGLSYYYSLANKTFDYIQAGVPSLQMAFPEYLRLQEKYEVFYILENLSVSSLVQAVQNIKSSPDEYLQLKNNCLKASQYLNWEQEEQFLWQFYERVGK